RPRPDPLAADEAPRPPARRLLQHELGDDRAAGSRPGREERPAQLARQRHGVDREQRLEGGHGPAARARPERRQLTTPPALEARHGGDAEPPRRVEEERLVLVLRPRLWTALRLHERAPEDSRRWP